MRSCRRIVASVRLVLIVVVGTGITGCATDGRPAGIADREAPPPSEKAVTNDLGFQMIAVPAGEFIMGDADMEFASPVHRVMLSSFWIMKTEVTQELYQRVMGSNPSAPESGFGADYPVNQVMWYDALVFANRLSRLQALEPVYSIAGHNDPDAWGEIPAMRDSTWDAVVMDRRADGYRLPTEAEWEYAARGATISGGTAYAGSDEPDQVAWHESNSDGTVHPVAGKMANELGLHDMSGNVWEWCWDLGGMYPDTDQVDPVVSTSEETAYRVVRGGGWSFNEHHTLVAFREATEPHLRDAALGFRLVRSQ